MKPKKAPKKVEKVEETDPLLKDLTDPKWQRENFMEKLKEEKKQREKLSKKINQVMPGEVKDNEDELL